MGAEMPPNRSLSPVPRSGRRRAAPPRRDRGAPRACVVVTLLLSTALFAPSISPLAAQESDETALVTLGGAALGLYSGSMLGLVGSLLPCDRTVMGPGCARGSAIVGGAIGLVAGGVIGANDTDQVRDRARGAAYGLLIGGLVGAILQREVRQYAWNDALLVAGYGAALGSAPVGTAIGTGVGAAVGGLAWSLSPRGGFQDLAMFTLIGATVGGFYDWVHGAVDAPGTGPAMTATFSIGVG